MKAKHFLFLLFIINLFLSVFSQDLFAQDEFAEYKKIGIVNYSNGAWYNGETLWGTPHGIGRLYYPDGKIQFEGKFYDGKPKGMGVYYFQNQSEPEMNGYYFVGNFLNENNGEGVLYNKYNDKEGNCTLINGSLQYDYTGYWQTAAAVATVWAIIESIDTKGSSSSSSSESTSSTTTSTESSNCCSNLKIGYKVYNCSLYSNAIFSDRYYSISGTIEQIAESRIKIKISSVGCYGLNYEGEEIKVGNEIWTDCYNWYYDKPEACK